MTAKARKGERAYIYTYSFSNMLLKCLLCVVTRVWYVLVRYPVVSKSPLVAPEVCKSVPLQHSNDVGRPRISFRVLLSRERLCIVPGDYSGVPPLSAPTRHALQVLY